jgi:O-antigen ligase
LISLFFLFCPLCFNAVVIEPTNAPLFFVGSILFSVILFFFARQKLEIVLPDLLLCLILLMYYGVHLFSIEGALNTADAIFESQKLFLGLTGLVIFLTWYNVEKDSHLLFKSMIIISLCFNLFSWVELSYFWLTDIDITRADFALMGHKNLLSSFVFLALPFSMYGGFTFKGSWRICSWLCIILGLGLIGLLQTRSVYLACAISTLVFCLFYFTSGWTKKNRLLLLLGFFVSVSVIVGFVLNYSRHPEKSGHAVSASLHERYQLWNNTFELVAEEPFWGVGAGNWQYNYSKFSVAEIEPALHYQTVFKSPHNDFLSVLSETGIAGFLLLFFVLILLAWKSISNILEEKNLKLLLVFSTLAGLLTDAFFSFPKDRIAHIIMASLLVAILIMSSGTVRSIRKRGYVLWSFFLVGLVFNLFVGWKRMRGEYYTLKLIEAQHNSDARGVIDYGFRAMSSFYKTDPTCTPIYSYIGWGYNAFGNLDSLLYVNEQAYALSPFDYKVLANYGYVLERRHQVNTAEKVLLEAYRINPNYESTLLNLSVLYYNSGRYGEALRWLQLIGSHEEKYPVNLQRIEDKL